MSEEIRVAVWAADGCYDPHLQDPHLPHTRLVPRPVPHQPAALHEGAARAPTK
jgi:hypothetical protein